MTEFSVSQSKVFSVTRLCIVRHFGPEYNLDHLLAMIIFFFPFSLCCSIFSSDFRFVSLSLSLSPHLSVSGKASLWLGTFLPIPCSAGVLNLIWPYFYTEILDTKNWEPQIWRAVWFYNRNTMNFGIRHPLADSFTPLFTKHSLSTGILLCAEIKPWMSWFLCLQNSYTSKQ